MDTAIMAFTCFVLGLLIGMFRMALHLKKNIVEYFKSTGRTERVSNEMADLIGQGKIDMMK